MVPMTTPNSCMADEIKLDAELALASGSVNKTKRGLT